MSQARMNEVAVGKKYVSTFGADGTKGTKFLDDNEELQRRIRDNQWIRWDGVEGTVQDHRAWVLKQLRYWTASERHDEFRPYGSKQGCQYFIHDEETRTARGYGLFKIVGSLNLEPKDLLAYVFDMTQVGEADATVALNKIIATYLGDQKGDPFAAVAYWSNYPGFPFHVRDGLDLTTYQRDDDGTMWQLSVSLTGGDYFQSQPGGLLATDRIFGFKLEPLEDGTTKVTMISHNALNGWIPKSLSNFMVCRVLIDYMKTIEVRVNERKKTGEHQKMLQQLELA